MVRRHLIITGRVQGVFYRAWFSERANALGLHGWIRNRTDGSVEAVVEGPPDAVKEIVTLARRGPAAARVDRVTDSAHAPTEALSGFAQRPAR